jgi:disulfide bond formation protein DsbB
VSPSRRADLLLSGVALGGVAAVGAALVSQHVFDMQPCPWCVLQRLVFLLVSAAALVGLVWRSAMGQRLSGGLVTLLALCGVSAALWQHFVAKSSASCNLTLAERWIAASGLDAALPAVFAAYASCADAAVDLAGLPYEYWSLALFAAIAGAGAVVAAQSARAD